MIRQLTGRSYRGLFVVPDHEVQAIKAELFDELESENLTEREEALHLLQQMWNRLSEEERGRVTAAARAEGGV